ncbi:MAG TPA: hypothetical protein VGQ81_16570 [Acidobacteriota bacterium]|jgi:hypothetical protein|nr:hypothetical protein [Acidobacteriota bacterium]
MNAAKPVTSRPSAAERLGKVVWSTFLFPLSLFVVELLLISPWGEYPLNDDWGWARVAKRFAETGTFKIDIWAYPSLFGQSLMAYPVIRFFGFSHLALRLLTILLACIGLWCLYKILECAAVEPGIRNMALLVVAFNPLYVYFAVSFMTELYGYFPALLGSALWFWDRRRREAASSEEHPGAIISWWAASLSGLLIGSTFWTRQYAILAYPPLLISSLFTLVTARNWRRLYVSIPALLLSAVLFCSIVLLYFPWARASGNLRPEFSGILNSMWRIDVQILLFQSGIFLAYMTAFFYPMLLCFRWRKMEWGKMEWSSMAVLAVLFLTGALITSHLLKRVRDDATLQPAAWLHNTFPYLGNVITNAGIGPVTLPDVYRLNLRRPQWETSNWEMIQLLIIIGSVLWAPVLVSSFRVLRRPGNRLASEVILFSALFSLGSLIVSVQSLKLTLPDRYHFPSVLALAPLLAVALSYGARSRGEPAEPLAPVRALNVSWRIFSPQRSAAALFVAALLPLAYFTIAGLHDYFRWNDVRWDFFNQSVKAGISPLNIQAGFETSGWTIYDAYNAKQTPPQCRGKCSCGFGWFCLDDSYLIGMNLLPDYEVVSSRRPSYWLASGPPIILSRRIVSP